MNWLTDIVLLIQTLGVASQCYTDIVKTWIIVVDELPNLYNQSAACKLVI